MGRELNHAEVRELLGVYALDAVDGDEAAAVERHLEDCPPCRAEVGDYREVVGLMAAGWLPAPDGVWDRIAGTLEEAPPAMRAPVPLGAARERRKERAAGPVRAAAAVAIAASVAFVGFLGVKVLDTSNRVGELAEPNVDQAAAAAAKRPDAHTVKLSAPDGSSYSADIVLLKDGTGYLTNSTLPPLPDDRTYQLWAVVGQAKISVGVLGSRPQAVAFRAAGNVSALAITEEIAGGVVASVQQPKVLGVVA